MTDNGNQQPANTASITAYTANGWRVHFSFTIASVADADSRLAELAAAGYTPTAPGAPDGGAVEMIGWVSRRVQINNDGRPDTPIIDLFLDNEGWQGRMVGIYLNTPEEIAAFEKACGVKLTALPLYEAAAPAKRDDARSSKYIVRLPHPAAAFIGDNPRWEGTDDKKNQKRKFFGWKDAPIAAPASTPANVVGSITPNSEAFDAAFPPNATVMSKHWTADTEAQKKFFQWANKTHGINDYAVLEALDVKALTLFTGTKQDALNAVKAFVDAKQREAS